MVASSSCSKLTAFSLMCINVHELKLLRIFLCFREKKKIFLRFLFLFIFYATMWSPKYVLPTNFPQAKLVFSIGISIKRTLEAQ